MNNDKLQGNIDDYQQKVLIVDDQVETVYAITLILKKLNIKIVTAGNGKEGVEKAEAEQPDMIILDIQMPIMDGFQACEILKNKEATKHIPIMFLTSKFVEIKNKVKGLDMGADDYLLKPFEPLELASRVKVMLRLRDAQLRLEQKNRHYMEMLSFISHELKNPLTSILGGAETLKNGIVGKLEPDQQKLIEIVDRNAAYIQSMIERYLSLSKLEKGEIIPDYKQIEFIEDALMPVLNNINILIERNNKKLIVENDCLNNQFIINSDAELLKVVLNNLFSNAIKYSDNRGLIKYSVARAADGNKLIFKIENTSEGITEEETLNIFNKFGRLKNAITLRQKGTGLGLYNSREILKILKGSIKCVSKLGEYVGFIVEIPV